MAYITQNGFRAYYEIRGQGQALLFIHGLGSSSRDWEMQVPAFEERYSVITYDVRGHGRSDKPPGPYSVTQFAQDAAGLLQELGMNMAHVVGISMGGMIAFELALNFPHMVHSLTVVNSYPEVRVESLKERLMVWRRFLLLEVLGMRGMGIALANQLFPRPDQESLHTTFVERWAENDKRAYRDTLRAIVGWDVEERLPEIQCPVLVVASDRDYLPLKEKRAYAEKLPRANLVVVQNARHAVTAEKPAVFNRTLESFLAQL